MLTSRQQRFLETRRVARLATADARGAPHVVPVCFAVADGTLYVTIDEKPKRRSGAPLKRLRNIAENPAVAVVADHYDEDWTRLGWVMLQGRADILSVGAEHARAQALLRARYPQARLWAILEPRSNTLRRRVLQADLARSLALADEVVVAAVFRSEAVPENERLELPELAADIQRHGRRARLMKDADEIVQNVAPEMSSGDVVAILSNGGFGGIYEKLPSRLRALTGEGGIVNSANAVGEK